MVYLFFVTCMFDYILTNILMIIKEDMHMKNNDDFKLTTMKSIYHLFGKIIGGALLANILYDRNIINSNVWDENEN